MNASEILKTAYTAFEVAGLSEEYAKTRKSSADEVVYIFSDESRIQINKKTKNITFNFDWEL